MVDTLVTGLVQPWSMAFLPKRGLLVAERSGRLLKWVNGQQEQIMGNVPKELRDVELHPNFEKNRWVYISYYIDPKGKEGGYTVLMRATLEGNRIADEKVLYKAGPFKEGGFWYGGKIVFDDKGLVHDKNIIC